MISFAYTLGTRCTRAASARGAERRDVAQPRGHPPWMGSSDHTISLAPSRFTATRRGGAGTSRTYTTQPRSLTGSSRARRPRGPYRAGSRPCRRSSWHTAAASRRLRSELVGDVRRRRAVYHIFRPFGGRGGKKPEMSSGGRHPHPFWSRNGRAPWASTPLSLSQESHQNAVSEQYPERSIRNLRFLWLCLPCRQTHSILRARSLRPYAPPVYYNSEYGRALTRRRVMFVGRTAFSRKPK